MAEVPDKKAQVIQKIKDAIQSLEQDEYDEYQETFKIFDKDGDGHIALDELYLAFKSLGKTKTREECEQMIA